MKYAFKVSRYVQTGKVLVTNLVLVPDDTEPFFQEHFNNRTRKMELVEVLHVHEDKEEARASRSWEVVAAHFHHFTPRHLAKIIEEDLARAKALGLSGKTLGDWMGRDHSYYSGAIKRQYGEPRKTAKLHIMVGQLEKLIDRAKHCLTDETRPYVQYPKKPELKPPAPYKRRAKAE